MKVERAAVRAATALIPPGAVRDRYQAEFRAELLELPVGRRLARMVSLAFGALALQRALVQSGAVAFAHSPWWCRARLHHHWQATRTDDGQSFQRCRDCGTDNDETYLTPASDIAGVMVRGPST